MHQWLNAINRPCLRYTEIYRASCRLGDCERLDLSPTSLGGCEVRFRKAIPPLDIGQNTSVGFPKRRRNCSKPSLLAPHDSASFPVLNWSQSCVFITGSPRRGIGPFWAFLTQRIGPAIGVSHCHSTRLLTLGKDSIASSCTSFPARMHISSRAGQYWYIRPLHPASVLRGGVHQFRPKAVIIRSVATERRPNRSLRNAAREPYDSHAARSARRHRLHGWRERHRVRVGSSARLRDCLGRSVQGCVCRLPRFISMTRN